MANTRPVILYATPVLHHPPIGGPTLRIENSIKALSRISSLYIYSRVKLDQIGGPGALKYFHQFCQDLYFAPYTVNSNQFVNYLRRTINFIARHIIGRNILLPPVQPKEDYGYLLHLADKIKADVIWLGFGNISYPLLKYIKSNSKYKVVVDTDSVWSRFVLRELPYAKHDKERDRIEFAGREKEKEEQWGTVIADVTTAVSEIDAEYYRNLVDVPKKVFLFSNVIDLDMYTRIPPMPTGFKKPCLYLAGTFWHNSPMEDAARWVIEFVLPFLENKIPDLHFYIIGSGSEKVLLDVNHPNISITGRLESVLPFLGHANVALVPLRFESGTRFKILEAGACMIPVVSTTLGAEGIEITDRHDILIADEPEAFAEAILQIINNPKYAKYLGENLRMLVANHYSTDTLTQEGEQIIEHITNLDFIIQERCS